ncbi:hypothetical protein [Azospirillum sp. sgz302134]
MTVVPFSRARFSPADLATFNAIALPRLVDGRWTSIARCSGVWGDRIAVMIADQPSPIFTFEREKGGGYALYFHDRGGAVLIGSGDSAPACLSIWSGTAGQRARSRGAA